MCSHLSGMSKCQQPLNYFKSMRNNSLVLNTTEDLVRLVTQQFLVDHNEKKNALQREMIYYFFKYAMFF